MYCCVINYSKTQNYLLWTNEKSTISPVTRYIMYVEKICTQTFYIVIVLLYSLWLILQEIKCETETNLNHLSFLLLLPCTLWISLNQVSNIVSKELRLSQEQQNCPTVHDIPSLSKNYCRAIFFLFFRF